MSQSVSSSRYAAPLMLASVVIIVAALYFAREVLIPLALAVLLSFVLAPAVRRLERLGLHNVVSVAIVTTFSFAVIALIGWAMLQQLVQLDQQLPRYRENIDRKVAAFRQTVGGLGRSSAMLQQIAENATTAPAQPNAAAPSGPVARAPIPVEIQEHQPSILDVISTRVQFVLGPLGTTGIIIVFVIFILIDRVSLRNRIIRLVSHGDLNITTRAMDDAAGRITRYLLMQLIVNVSYGVPIATGLWLIGIPGAMLWGLLAVLLRFIPYIGPWIAAAMPILLAFAAFDGYVPLLATAGLFVVMELISNNIMEPWLYGTSTGMSSVAVLISAVFWTWLWGPLGLLLATPLTVCLVVLGKYVPQLSFLTVLLGDEPVLDPSARVYQRLLARDADEAGDLLEEYLEEHSLVQLYDQVLIPALSMAERDRHRQRLEPGKQRYIASTVRDFVEDFGERFTATADAEAQLDENARTALIVPARDEADEIVALMLAQALRINRYAARLTSTRLLASELAELIAQQHPPLVFISALPPAAMNSAKYLCKRIRPHAPSVRLAIGLWGVSIEQKKTAARLQCGPNDQLISTLDEATRTAWPLQTNPPQSPATTGRTPPSKPEPAPTPSSPPHRP